MNATIRSFAFLYEVVLTGGLLLACSNAAGQSGGPIVRSPVSQARLIQGRITGIEGHHVTVKTPDLYPGTEGVHAHFVVAGSSFTTDISRARVLLADGVQIDKRPLEIGENVVVLLSGPELQPAARGTAPDFKHSYTADIIERLVQGDKLVNH